MRGSLRKLTYPLRRWPRLSKAALFTAALGIAVVGLSNAYIVLSTRGEATGDVAAVPPAEVAIVPGALVQGDGRMSAMLADRVRQASALWQAGKVKRILVSGDHHTWGYDEPDTMRKALIAEGVPPRVIFEDHAGLDTWATMSRARGIFGVRSAVVVTQGFHMPRALYLANAAGIDATGLTADLHEWGWQGEKSTIREYLSRVKAIADTTLDTAAIGGPSIPISGDDGRVSWGPTAARRHASRGLARPLSRRR